jgi:hypothetical protein
MATARDTYITEQLATEGMANTAANRKKLGKRYDQIYLGGKKDDWRTYFKLQFPQLGDMLDGADGEKNARAIFGDLIDLFVEIATNPAGFDLTSDAGIQAFYRRVDATQYAIKTTANQAEYDALDTAEKERLLAGTRASLSTKYASAQLTTGELNQIAQAAIRNGYSELEIKYAVAAQLGQRAGSGGLLETDEANKLRSTLKAFNYKVTDELFSAALMGEEVNGVPQSAELLTYKAKERAKLDFPAYASYIDAGLTVDDIFEPYKDLSAKTLELSPVDVNLDDDKFLMALKGKEDGTQYSGTEWVRMLKTDPEYNWRFTNQANQQVNSVVSALEKSFGLSAMSQVFFGAPEDFAVMPEEIGAENATVVQTPPVAQTPAQALAAQNASRLGEVAAAADRAGGFVTGADQEEVDAILAGVESGIYSADDALGRLSNIESAGRSSTGSTTSSTGSTTTNSALDQQRTDAFSTLRALLNRVGLGELESAVQGVITSGRVSLTDPSAIMFALRDQPAYQKRLPPTKNE